MHIKRQPHTNALKVKGILKQCIYHPSQSQAACRPDGPRPTFMLLPSLPSSVLLAIVGCCCAPVSQGRGGVVPAADPGLRMFISMIRERSLPEVRWACFCVFSIMHHSSGLIGEPRDAGGGLCDPATHTKNQGDGGPVLKEEKAAGVVSLSYAWEGLVKKKKKKKGDGVGNHHKGRRR